MAKPKRCRVWVDWETIKLLHKIGADRFDISIETDVWQAMMDRSKQGETLSDTIKRWLKEGKHGKTKRR